MWHGFGKDISATIIYLTNTKVMKTRIATVMLLLGLFLSSAAFATEPVPANSTATMEIKNLVTKKLSYPQFAIDNKTECDVYLSIKVNKDGSLDVDCANCQCERLKGYVVKSVERINSDKLIDFAGQTMLLKVSFDLKS